MLPLWLALLLLQEAIKYRWLVSVYPIIIISSILVDDLPIVQESDRNAERNDREKKEDDT